jgi:hypothetical protein
LAGANLSSIPGTSKIWIFQDLSTLSDLNWIVLMLKSDLMEGAGATIDWMLFDNSKLI